jgi:hypothetical protein
MLETLFIWCLILIPLGIAVVLIAYRARFFIVGIIGIVTLMMLVWAGLRFAAMLDDGAAESVESRTEPTAMQLRSTDDRAPIFDMRIVGT